MIILLFPTYKIFNACIWTRTRTPDESDYSEISNLLPYQFRLIQAKWAELDLNQQNPKTPDLQSGPLPITGYLPI